MAFDLMVVLGSLSCVAGQSPSPSTWSSYGSANCYDGHGATDLENPRGSTCGYMSVGDCENKCDELPGCTGVTVSQQGGCYRRSNIVLSECSKGNQYTTYVRSSLPPSPPTPSPTPPTPPSPADNPLGITPNPKRSDNFFLIIGDWGAPTDWSSSSGGCQQKVAQMMKDYVNKYQQQGKKCLFVGAVGDNFYASGVKDDGHWAKQWGNVYGTDDPSSGLHDVPWLAVLGNHDLGGDDKECACGGLCKQFNNGGRPAGTEKFWMPDYYWHYNIDQINLEIVGLDTNAVDVGNLGGDGCNGGAKATCDYCGGQSKIQDFLNKKMSDSESYMDQRARITTATTVVILQHYNEAGNLGNVGSYLKNRFETNNKKAAVLSAYGHRHDQMCEGDRTHGCDVILTGGGGGWQGGGYFGFTAVHLTDDGGFETILETNEVRIPQNSCSYLTDDGNVDNATESAHVTLV